MPNKKPKQNPFIYFCMEKKQLHESLRNKTLPELVNLCGSEWTQMTQEERRPYIETAKQFAEGRIQPSLPPSSIGNSSRQDFAGRFDGYGRSFLKLQTEQLQQRHLDKLMKDDISRNIDGESVADFRFHIMSVNSWVVMDQTGETIPCEIALVEISLRSGISRKYIQLIDPGEIPKGYQADVKINSEKYHGIQLNNPELTNSYKEVLDSLKTVLRATSAENYACEGFKYDGKEEVPSVLSFARYHRLLPIYVVPDDKRPVEKALKWLASQQESTQDYEFMIYDLVFLFQQLVHTAPIDGTKKMSMGAAEAHLLRDVFLYLPSVSCHYHHQIGSSKCAGARASRIAHIICDFTCQMYGIRPKEGGHLPWGISSDSVVIDTPNTSLSSISSTSSECMQDLNFIADSRSANYTRTEDLPLHATNIIPSQSLDAFHILHSYIDHSTGQGLRFRSVEDLLSQDPPVHVDIEESMPFNEDTYSLFESTRNDSLNSFFDDVQSHPVYENLYRGGRSGPLVHMNDSSFVTADESY